MKKKLVLLAVMMSFTLTACGQNAETDNGVNGAVNNMQEEADVTEDVQDDATAAEEEAADASSEETTDAEAEDKEVSGEATELPADEVDLEKTFADNFEVDAETKSAYAKKIKEAVATKDLEALADLTAFPVYVSIAENGGAVETREDFLALGAEKVFTPELLENIANGDDTELPPSMAGFTFSKDGLPDITFGVGADGTLGINGINY